LLDVPQFIVSVPEQDKHKFLEDTKAELARIGGLEIRKKFISSFAEVVRSPSKESVKGFTDFLFDKKTPQEFRDTLMWDKRCDGAIRFLRLIHELVEYLERGNIEKRKKQQFLNQFHKDQMEALGKLEGVDECVVKEWYRLFYGLCRIVAPKKPGKKKARKVVVDPPSRDRPLPKSISNPSEVPHLVFFQTAARKVYVECLAAFYKSIYACLEV
jgi:hypothetical protein